MARLYAGTSGFAYPAWKPGFYPEKLPQKKFLEHYATRLNAVEVNYSFKRLISASTIEGWLAQTGEGFRFAPKAHERITHFGRLKGPADFTEAFFRSIDPLRIAGRLGPVLFQLPPNLKRDDALLGDFLKQVPKDVRAAFEFRHVSWLDDAVYGLLRENNVALCLAESETLEIPEVMTADFVYWRLRKLEYTAGDRAEVAAKAKGALEAGRDVYVFFKHEDTPDGALHAEEVLGAGR